MMAAMTRLMSLLSNKRGNKPDQDEIILQKILNKLWLLLVANGCWPLLSHCCWTPLTRLQIAFVSSVLGLYWPFVPRPFVSPQQLNHCLPDKNHILQKRKCPKNLWYFLAFVPRRPFVSPQSDLALAEPLLYKKQTSALPYLYQKENIPGISARLSYLLFRGPCFS